MRKGHLPTGFSFSEPYASSPLHRPTSDAVLTSLYIHGRCWVYPGGEREAYTGVVRVSPMVPGWYVQGSLPPAWYHGVYVLHASHTHG